MIFYAVLCYTAPECVVLAHNRAGFGGGLAKVGDSPVWATHPWSTLNLEILSLRLLIFSSKIK